MIWQVVKKDWKLLWPLAALVFAIQFGFEWTIYSLGSFGESSAAAALLKPLSVAWIVGIAALSASVVHQDPLPGVDQDWLIRPLSRTQLLVAKLLFILLTVTMPMFALNLADALASGFALGPSILAVLLKSVFVFACFIVPVVALASFTRSMTELVAMSAALVVTFAFGMSVSAFMQGPGWCPTCNSGVSWIQHGLQHVGTVAGAALILTLQYGRRLTQRSRAVAIIGALLLVFVQLPWNAAFALQRWLGPSGAASGITVEFADEVQGAAASPATTTDKVTSARRAAQSLMEGHVDQAVGYLRRRSRASDAPVTIQLPLRVTGATADQLLLADRTALHLSTGDGHLLYAGDDAGALAALLTPYADRSNPSPSLSDVRVDIPGKVYRKTANTAVQLRLEFSLTLMQIVARQTMAALDGELRTPDGGTCATIADRSSLSLRCRTLSRAPFCYSATLMGPGQRHNPEVLKCTPDYRRYLPPFMSLLALYGVDLPLLDRTGAAHYDIDESLLGTATILVKIYSERDHFTGGFMAPVASLESMRVGSD